jgi:hypothetical protein
VRSGTS